MALFKKSPFLLRKARKGEHYSKNPLSCYAKPGKGMQTKQTVGITAYKRIVTTRLWYNPRNVFAVLLYLFQEEASGTGRNIV